MVEWASFDSQNLSICSCNSSSVYRSLPVSLSNHKFIKCIAWIIIKRSANWTALTFIRKKLFIACPVINYTASSTKLLLLNHLLNQCKFAVFPVQNLQIHHVFGYIFEVHLHEFGAPNFLNIISIFMSYIDNSLFWTYKTIGLPVKSN